MRSGLRPLVALTLCLISAGAGAQTPASAKPEQAAAEAKSAPPDRSPPAVNPGRPTVTDPAALTVPGWLETEFGVAKNLNRDRNMGTPLLFKLTAPGGRTQARLAFDGYVSLGDGSFSGFGDTYLAVQHLFRTQDHGKWDISGRLHLKMPTASDAIGTGKVDFGALLLASRDFTPSLHGDFNLGLTSLTRQQQPGTDTQAIAAASFTIPIPGGRWQYTNELVWTSAIAGTRAAVTTMHGVTYAVHRWDVYDAAVQWSLSGDGATWQVLFGRTFFLGKLF